MVKKVKNKPNLPVNAKVVPPPATRPITKQGNKAEELANAFVHSLAKVFEREPFTFENEDRIAANLKARLLQTNPSNNGEEQKKKLIEEFYQRELEYQRLWLDFCKIASTDDPKVEFILDQATVDSYHTKILEHILDTFKNTLKLDGLVLKESTEAASNILNKLFNCCKQDINNQDIKIEINNYNEALKKLLENIQQRFLYKNGIHFLKYRSGPQARPTLDFSNITNKPEGEKRKVAHLEIPIDHYLDVNCKNPNHELAYSQGGHIFLNLVLIEESTIRHFKNAKNLRKDFEKLFQEKKDFSFYKDPGKAKYYLIANGIKASEDENLTKNQLKEQVLVKAGAELATKAFIEAKSMVTNKSKDWETFWFCHTASFEDELKENILINDSIAKNAYEYFIQDHGYLATGLTNNFDLKFLNQQIISLEGRLWQLCKAANPAFILGKCLYGIILPENSDHSPIEKSDKHMVGNLLDNVLITRILTEKLLGDEGKEVSKLVNWNELICEGENKLGYEADFEKEWQEYISNPEKFVQESKDPQGLMRLRAVWYKFFDEKMGRFDKYIAFVESGAIQEAAREALKENFLSYTKRAELYTKTREESKNTVAPETWTEFYRQNIAFN